MTINSDSNMRAINDLDEVANPSATGDYTAADIEILEGLEPVRRRPGMYIGGVCEKSMHHLFAEAIDNAMDEAINGYATCIKVHLNDDGSVSVSDNGRGIPIDFHPKFPEKSALEVIMTTLHSGGKFAGRAYDAAGGLHGVGISVVNALSQEMMVEVARDQILYRQSYSRGQALSPLEVIGKRRNLRGTRVVFKPDSEIFGATAKFTPKSLFQMTRAKAYLFGGVELRWSYPGGIAGSALTKAGVPREALFYFPGGLVDLLRQETNGLESISDEYFSGKAGEAGKDGSLEWAIGFVNHGDSFLRSYCNTIPTSDGGSHEVGLRGALLRALRNYAELSGYKRATAFGAEDILGCCVGVLSVFIKEPTFSGQTKTRLSSSGATSLVEGVVRDAFEHWLSAAPERAGRILEACHAKAEERLRLRRAREISRKSATTRIRLPGKLADCSRSSSLDTELFIVEGDSAGGSAKSARDRKTQAVLPLRGKILNVVNAGYDKLLQNQQLSDLLQALGCGFGDNYQQNNLRYDRVIIMTDADVDGAHIASLLISFFFTATPQLIIDGHLYLAVPPLYRLSSPHKTLYAKDDRQRDKLLAEAFKNSSKVEIGRFKGLGEMLPKQLKQTTMDPANRTLLQVVLDSDLREATANIVEQLLGSRPEGRFKFIQERASSVRDIDI